MRGNKVRKSLAIMLGLVFLAVIIALAAGTAKKENDSVAAGLERGEKLFNTIGCANCHPKGGTTGGSVSMMDMEIPIPTLKGAAAHFPTVKGPNKMLVTLGQMNNMCLTMILKKEAMDYDSQEYVDLALYVTSLSKGRPMMLKEGMMEKMMMKPPMKPPKKEEAVKAVEEEAMVMAGKGLFESKCKACHPLERPLSKIGVKTAEEWAATVMRMQAKGAPGNISDGEAKLITEYLQAQSKAKE